MAMKLGDVYAKMNETEKTATAKGGEVDLDAVIADLGLKDVVKTAEDREVVKLALSYDAMGREIARQTFVTEILGQPVEKTAAIIEEILKGEKAEPEKTAAVDEDALLAELGLIEKKAEPKAGDKAEPTEEEKLAEVKQGALRELVSKLVASAKGGVKKAAVALQKIAASSPENKTVVANAIKNHGKDDKDKKGGNLAKFLAMKKDKAAKK